MPTTFMDARNPLTGLQDYRFMVDSPETIQRGCAELRQTQPQWQALGVEGRMAALADLSAAFRQQSQALFSALSTDTGRQRVTHTEIGAVQGMIGLGLSNAAAVFSSPGWRASAIPGIFGQQQLLPLPVIGVIAPWNFPLMLSMLDTIPALLAGCAVALKPSEITPRYVEPLRSIFASVPPLSRVVRIFCGDGATGAALVGEVDGVVCTGSIATGRKVAEEAARHFIPAFLELGGKDAVIITRDGDLTRAVTTVLRAALQASGQACQSLERVYIDRAVQGLFLDLLRAGISAVKTTAEDPQGQIGPFIMARQAEVVRDHLADALAKGAKLEAGGHIVEKGGLWCEPTLLSNVNHSMRIMTEETFGPVIPVMAFDSVDEAIALANAGDYGLSANVLAGTEAQGLAIGQQLQAGFVSINDVSLSSYVADFEWEGFRHSGLGRSRTGPAGIARYLKTKAIVVNRGATAPITDLGDR